MPKPQPIDQDTLRAFRHLAVETRAASQKVKHAIGELRVVGGYLESADILERYHPLCIPVRRAYLESDRVSLLRVCHILKEMGSEDVSQRVSEVLARYQQVREDLASHTILNARPLGHSEVFDAWLDAAVFGTFSGKDQRYRTLLDECGKAVEGIAVRITEAVADRVLELDDLVVDVLRRTPPA